MPGLTITPQELVNIINTQIIDNNIQAINPAIMRNVLKAMIICFQNTNTIAISAEEPIQFDSFTGLITMLQASSMQDGWLSKEDFATFLAGSAGTSAYDVFDFVKKGFGNSGPVGEEGDVYQGWVDATHYSTHAVYDGAGDLNDPHSFEHIGPFVEYP